MGLGGISHWIIILVIVLLLFGAGRVSNIMILFTSTTTQDGSIAALARTYIPPLHLVKQQGRTPPNDAWKLKARCFVPTLEMISGGCRRLDRVVFGSGVATIIRCAQ